MMKSIRDLVQLYLEDLQVRNYRPRTVSDYGYHLAALETFLNERGMSEVSTITTLQLAEFQRWLYHLPTKRGKARGVLHLNVVLAAVRSFFRFLRRDGYVVRDVSAELEYAREPRRLPRNVLTVSEARRIIEKPDTGTLIGCRDRAILEVFYATGLRSGELRGLCVEDVNFEEELIRVNAGKGGHDRVVPMGSSSVRWVQSYLQGVRPRFMQGPRARRSLRTDWLFLSWSGGPLDPHTLGDLVKRYAKLARVKKHVTCHVWRHTCATHMIQNRANVRHVQEMMGHRSLATTERYLHLTIADLKAAHTKFHPRERA